ncbi:saccharopine dehydrogenase family protein [Botryobacter ruber]|uniref:saccharopine dehydrogenase family protein n=1 Tax=Botryobacter ruber TaxID=2171629 RepID=UPI000E0C0F1A|nr:saccharopine dehydrogenase family protein [Botryobacter ruber]
MKKILLLGAGRSAASLIRYLLTHAAANGWHLTIGDVAVEHLQQTVAGLPYAEVLVFDVHNRAQRAAEVSKADLVISMLPAVFHPEVAKECVKQGKHLLTASYVTPVLRELHEEALQKNLLLLMESGLDPGIDHMSAMAVLQQLRGKGARLLSFKSYTGGLVAPESDNNPWHYKFTWNPRNVVLAGQSTSKYIQDGTYKYIPYPQLFRRTETIQVKGYGAFEGYANRDSLSYREPYGLTEIPTMLRGTLRRPGYCAAWDALVQLGMTDDSYQLENSENLTCRQFTEAFLPPASGDLQQVQQRVGAYLNLPIGSDVLQKLEWLGLFTDAPVALARATPAQVLEKILQKKWRLESGDKDMIVMQHQFVYELNGKKRELKSSLVVKGEDEVHTAMAKTVGLPVGILAKLLLQGRISQRGVVIPIHPAIYEPVLEELKQYGVNFVEQEREW